MQQEPPEAPEQSAVSKRTLEIVTAIFFLVIGSVVMWDSLRSGAGWGNDGPQSGYFPFYVGLLMSVASAANLFLAVRSSNTESFVSRPQIKLVLAIFLPCLPYLFSIICVFNDILGINCLWESRFCFVVG